MWCGRMDAIAASRHEEFEGRSSSSGNQAELYPEMNSDTNGRYSDCDDKRDHDCTFSAACHAGIKVSQVVNKMCLHEQACSKSVNKW